MSPRALITGGAGFIGSHLTEALLAGGWQVDVLDDLSTGQRTNVAPFVRRPGYSFTHGSAADPDVVDRLVPRADAVFHLAAAVGVRLIVEQPVRTITTNIRATELVLECAARHGRAVLVASSSEVYGKLERPMFCETDDLVLGATERSRWCYAASKIIDEHLALAFVREKGLRVTVVRLFNTIGPRQTGCYGMVVPRFIQQALAGRPITVFGDGSQRRSFTWVGDAVRAMIALLDHAGAAGQVYNVGHTRDISIRDLALLVKQLCHSTSPIHYVPFERAYERGFEDMQRRLPDIGKLQQAIGYAPSLDLPEILERIIAHERAAGRLDGRAVRAARAVAVMPSPDRLSARLGDRPTA